MESEHSAKRIPEVSVLTEPWFGILASRKQDLTRQHSGQKAQSIVSVFGGSAAKTGTAAWQNAYRIGREIAKMDGIVISGGYGGVMEAASQGAQDAGGLAIGVTCNNLMGLQPNKFLDHIWDLDRWDQRLLALVWLSDAYVVMPGASGTLVELSMVIETQKKGFIPRRNVVCFTKYWEPVVKRIDGTKSFVNFSRSSKETARLAML